MLHFPSTLRSTSTNGLPKRSEHLNATQQKSGSNPMFLKIEEELHDARRVQAHGQEEDLRLALDMVINRVTELSSMLSDAFRTQADLEVQLNVAKSNLALVIANNEMLEDALKRDTTGSSRDVGWRRRSAKDTDVSVERKERQSLDEWQQVPAHDTPTGSSESLPNSAVSSPQIPNQSIPASASNPNSQESSRFFRFRFASTASSSRPTTRPTTPSASAVASPQIPPSPVTPSIPPHVAKELEDLNAELQKERSARKAAEQDKTNLEAEIESLSQALFEEANKMVATERIKLAETEEELKQLQSEKDALKRALRLIEGENTTLREHAKSASTPNLDYHPNPEELQHSPNKISRSRSSSEVAVKSRPSSLILESAVPLPPSPAPHLDTHHVEEDDRFSSLPHSASSQLSIESQTTPKNPSPPLLPPTSPSPLPLVAYPVDHASPWADVPSRSSSRSITPNPDPLYGAALAMR
ncbi:hypothetical protein NP233_g8179 [Leucocoprinus birnbaumii]|uniref:GDP/GTP exchange factor Sec2 N-terminal domain-containing protein n=1 Tax=Leucocoprinus birnbaumii TaxID=56174 RepID=A0AAD5VQI3_9AGAR|nr:hypothetical protein NP233_g8179 [Leucocoprinus birnbaumii]